MSLLLWKKFFDFTKKQLIENLFQSKIEFISFLIKFVEMFNSYFKNTLNFNFDIISELRKLGNLISENEQNETVHLLLKILHQTNFCNDESKFNDLIEISTINQLNIVKFVKETIIQNISLKIQLINYLQLFKENKHFECLI
jgi:hypothetical protein